MTLTTILISAICILLVLGYQFDFSKRTVEQGGLLQFRSFPSGATIGLDGANLPFVTPGKRNVDAGTHTVNMSLKGYRPWAKTVSVKPGELLWLNYTRFVPQSITTTQLREFPKLAAILPSPDRESILLLPDAAAATLQLADIRDANDVTFTTLKLDPTVYTSVAGQPHKFSLQEWGFDSRYVIVKHTTGKTTEFLRVDTRDVANTVNVTKTLGLPLSKIHFSGTSGNVFYILSSGNLRRVDIGNKTISAPLVEAVTTFSMYGDDTIAYTAKAPKEYVAGIYRDGRSTVVARHNTAAPLSVAVTEYFSRVYLAVGRDKRVDIYVDPQNGKDSNKVIELDVLHKVAWVDFSNNGRFLVAGNGSDFMTYDVEKKESFTATLPKARLSNAPFSWLDDFYFVSTGGSDLRISEFDGTNQQFITDVTPGFEATLGADGEALYSVTRLANGKYAMQSSQMVID